MWKPLLPADEVIGVCRADVDLHLAHRPGEDACCRRVVVADRRTGIASQVDLSVDAHPVTNARFR